MIGIDDTARFLDRVYGEVFGTPEGVFQVDEEMPGRPHIDVYRYVAPTSRVLVTAGMSTRTQGDGKRRELYMRVPLRLGAAHVAAMCRSLWRAAHWPFGTEAPGVLAAGHTLHGLPPLADGSKLNAFVFAPRPKPDDATMTPLCERLRLDVVYALGVTDKELRAIEAKGREGVRDAAAALASARGFVTDPRR